MIEPQQTANAAEAAELAAACRAQVSKIIVGYEQELDFLLVALFTEGHVLLEGPPGVAKTLAVQTLARVLDCSFTRIQFTPDLMPSDIIGTSVYNYQKGEFIFKPGPIFTNFLLGDEINRAPAKTQSALLEAMQDRTVSHDGVTVDLEDVFTVFATQNPLEHEGTYPLPEAQLDRFMFKILLGYPNEEEEKRILREHHATTRRKEFSEKKIEKAADVQKLRRVKQIVREVKITEEVLSYVAKLTRATRVETAVDAGASPRASLMLLIAAKGLAALDGREFVIPDDVKRAALPVLRHRIILKPTAEIAGASPDEVIMGILNRIEVPR
jgi:MoxR-like ATPase